MRIVVAAATITVRIESYDTISSRRSLLGGSGDRKL
jgi:hypothetical protein